MQAESTSPPLKIALLHQDPEWTEEHLRLELEAAGHCVRPLDVRASAAADAGSFDLILNRVYASVGNRAPGDTRRALGLLARFEAAGIACLNSAAASRADYDKHHAARLMTAHGIPTPFTLMLRDPGEARRRREDIDRLGFPLVLKPNTGGRARGVRLVSCREAMPESLAEAFGDGSAAGIIVQPYLPSTRSYDWRISVAAGRLTYGGIRHLVPGRPGEAAWLGSLAQGSAWADRQPDPAAVRLALRASAAIGAEVNDVDLRETAAGLVVIENNPTPSFAPGDEPYLGRLLANLRSTHTWRAAQRRARRRIAGELP
jgi:glutathione synthase/RimK-type ligase-like ATP-grasp enzyme